MAKAYSPSAKAMGNDPAAIRHLVETCWRGPWAGRDRIKWLRKHRPDLVRRIEMRARSTTPAEAA